ncbi:hypothetical protein [Methanolobus chelungpuianus]|uniref:hypothetical protein n=1 Tax=Methanolobus chelungpuianus TaxID=502115 RepID=UPI00211515A9|nr:hypothetical protein [Methanolobus chelungpuianus]
MKGMIVALLLMLAFFSSGCTERSDAAQDISDDVVIVHLSYGAFTLPEIAVRELIVNETAVNLSYYGADRELTARYVRPVNESVRNGLLDLFRKNGFLSMEGSYGPEEGEPIVTDIDTVEISLIQDGLNKTVRVDPYYEAYMPRELREIDQALRDLKAYAMSTGPEDARAIAGEWIINAPTYDYDGSNLTLADHVVLDSFPEQHEISYEFVSSHAGYGNRSGEGPAVVVTPHTIVVRVAGGEVTSAVMDGTWDEMYQRMLSDLVSMESSMPCDEVPWVDWYEGSSTRFPAGPGEEDVAIKYFSDVYSIGIEGFEDISQGSDSCSYRVQVRQRDVRAMEDIGWMETLPSTFYLLT